MADKATTKLFDTIYFSLCTIYGWIVLSKTEYFPYMLGGAKENDMKHMWSEFPVIQAEYLGSLRFYYLASLGFHINSLRAIGWAWYVKEVKPDWVEMTLHHLLTVSLYAFSYMTNTIKIGSLIMFLHDWADIWTAFTKFWVDTPYKNITLVCGAIIWCSWFYSRLVVFPQVIYWGVYVYPIQVAFPNSNIDGHID